MMAASTPSGNILLDMSHSPAVSVNAKPQSKIWLLFVAGAVLSWGAYGALLGLGTAQLANPLKALLCVGVAYFLIGVIIPVASLSAQKSLSAFNSSGLITATIA